MKKCLLHIRAQPVFFQVQPTIQSKKVLILNKLKQLFQIIILALLCLSNAAAQDGNIIDSTKLEDCTYLLGSENIHFDQINDERLLVKYFWEKGFCYLDNSQLLEGLNYLLKAEELINGENPKLPDLLVSIGAVYDELEVFEKTLEYGLKAQKIAQKNKDYMREMECIHAVLSGAFALRKFDLLKEASQRAVLLTKNHGADTTELGYIYYLLGKTAIIEKRADLAIGHFNNCFVVGGENMTPDNISGTHEGLGMAYFQKNDLTKAKYHAELALEYEPPYISDRTLGLAQILAKNNEYKRAYILLEEDAIKKIKQDSLNNPSAIISTLLTEKIDQDKSRFDSELELEKELGFQKLLIGLFMAVLSFLAFLFFYNKRKNETQKRKLKTQVKEQTQEILEQKDKLKELDIAKTRLYTNITHEFRTPLTVISGIAEQLNGNEKNKSLIKRNSDQLLNLVNQMLDLRKIESGEISIKKTQGDIIKFMRYLTESLKSYAEMKGLTVHFLSDEKKLMMDFDGEKMTRIHSNLLSNAIKFTPDGGDIYVQLYVEKKEGGKEFIMKVRDTGVGISADKLPHIFERFYQADDSSTRQGEGTGIGLTLVSELVKAMNGEVKVSSTTGEGTTFFINLPITNISELAGDAIENRASNLAMIDTLVPASPNPGGASEPNANDPSKPVALIVEDNADVIHYLINCLKEKYNIEIAMNGEEGIEKAIRHTPDIIVSDVMMPIKDGFELCQTLKTDERTSHIPIVLLTAKADMESRLEGLKRGADAYLGKPFHQEELLIIMQNQLVLRKKLQGRFSQFTEQPLPGEIAHVLENKEIEIQLETEDAFLQKIRAVIEKDLSDSDIGMPQLMRKIGMSRSQIFKKTKALTGRSPSLYIRSIRLYHARDLLKTSELNVSEVAYEVGFSSPVYFSDVFLEEFGVRPNEMRK